MCYRLSAFKLNCLGAKVNLPFESEHCHYYECNTVCIYYICGMPMKVLSHHIFIYSEKDCIAAKGILKRKEIR